jgi:hypothetical protein
LQSGVDTSAYVEFSGRLHSKDQDFAFSKSFDEGDHGEDEAKDQISIPHPTPPSLNVTRKLSLGLNLIGDLSSAFDLVKSRNKSTSMAYRNEADISTRPTLTPRQFRQLQLKRRLQTKRIKELKSKDLGKHDSFIHSSLLNEIAFFSSEQ